MDVPTRSADSIGGRNGSGLGMEVVVVYRGRVRAPREARVVFWEGVRSGLGWQEAAVAAGFPRGGRVPGGGGGWGPGGRGGGRGTGPARWGGGTCRWLSGRRSRWGGRRARG